MNATATYYCYWTGLVLCLFLAACSSTRTIREDGFRASVVSADSLVNRMPFYTHSLTTLRGSARAVVSEPGATERVRLTFSSDRKKSLVTVKNNLGIEGGQLLTDGDTLLIYDKLEKEARKIAVRGADLDRINRIASLNILDMMNYTVAPEHITSVQENNDYFLLRSHSGTTIILDKESYLIQQVEEPVDSNLPYSKIVYGAYGRLNGFVLPRRITIFGPDEESKIDLQVTSLEINPERITLEIEIPDDIPVYRQ